MHQNFWPALIPLSRERSGRKRRRDGPNGRAEVLHDVQGALKPLRKPSLDSALEALELGVAALCAPGAPPRRVPNERSVDPSER